MQASFAVSDPDVCVANPRHREHLAGLVDRLVTATKAPNVFVKNDRGTLVGESPSSNQQNSYSLVYELSKLISDGCGCLGNTGPAKFEEKQVRPNTTCIISAFCNMVVSLNRGSSIKTPKHYSPRYP